MFHEKFQWKIQSSEIIIKTHGKCLKELKSSSINSPTKNGKDQHRKSLFLRRSEEKESCSTGQNNYSIYFKNKIVCLFILRCQKLKSNSRDYCEESNYFYEAISHLKTPLFLVTCQNMLVICSVPACELDQFLSKLTPSSLTTGTINHNSFTLCPSLIAPSYPSFHSNNQKP